MAFVVVIVVVVVVVLRRQRMAVVVVVVVFMAGMLAAGEAAAMGVGIHQHAEGDLANLVAALGAASSRPGRLHGRQQETHQRADDGNHDEQLDEREGPRPHRQTTS